MESQLKRDNGFSLLEVLIALSILSSSVLLFSYAISQIRTTRDTIRDDRQIEWHLFINQLEFELLESDEVSASRDELLVTKTDAESGQVQTITFERYHKILRRRVGLKGHQPMLMEVSSVRFSLIGDTLTVAVIFGNGETYQARLQVNDKG